MNRPLIAITGAGAVASLGRTRRELFQAALAGRCGCGPAPDIESGPVPETGAAQAVELPEDFAPELGREARYLRWAALEALREAGLAPGDIPAQRVAAAIGTTLHGIRAGGRWLRGAPITELRGMQAPVILREALGGLGVEGPRLTTCAACASGLTGVSLARSLLQAGEADVALAGGYDPISEYASAGFASLRLVAAGPQRPFCRDREGLKVAEGYGVLVLERLEDALAREAGILAVITGAGETSDGRHLTQPHPEGAGAARAAELALAESGIRPDEIGLICAHATGTPANDSAEAAALRTTFGDALAGAPIVTFKSHLGHTLGGAGAVELALAVEAMREGVAPPAANVSAQEIEFDQLDVVTESPRRARIGATLNLSIGFGGSNAAVAMARQAAVGAEGGAECEEVVITGIGLLLPGVSSGAELSALLAAPARHLDQDLGAPEESAYMPLLDPRKSRRLSEYARLSVAAATLALDDAGVDDRAAFCECCDAALGTAHGSPTYAEAYYREIVESGPQAANPMLFAEGVPNAGAAQLSIGLGLRGACQTVLGSRTAGLEALHVAALRIAGGRAQRAIVCAAEECAGVVAEAYRAWGLGARKGAHNGVDAFFIAGGAVALTLESASSAAARGARIRGRIGASALGCADDLAPGAFARRAAAVLGTVGADRAPVLHAASGAWPDVVERRAARSVGCAIGAALPWANAEFFSVGPLTAVAAATLENRGGRVLAVDFHGPIAAVAIEPGPAGGAL